MMASEDPPSAVRQTLLPPAGRNSLTKKMRSPSLAFIRGLFGAVSGAGFFMAIAHNLPLTFDQKALTGLVFTMACTVGGLMSSSFRCMALLMFPSMLGSRGRSYVVVLILSVLSTGPVMNIQQNIKSAALSVSCNMDLQINNNRILWRDAIKPYITVMNHLMKNKQGFQSKTQSTDTKFQVLREELIRQYGYTGFKKNTKKYRSTQEQFVDKTKMQCNDVIEAGIKRCRDWFKGRWKQCMKTIFVPIINHILCAPLILNFLCDIMKVMEPWCRDNVPVEGNFGQMYDKVDDSVKLLSMEFTTEVEVEEEDRQDVLSGAGLDNEITEAVAESFRSLKTLTKRVMEFLQMLLTFTFITIFFQAFGYLRSYNKDIYFDNVYISKYFRQIDAHRRKAGKRFLLPLQVSDRKKLIDPRSPRIHQQEIKDVMSGVVQLISISLFAVVLLSVDFTLSHVLDIISRHTFTEFNLSSEHHIEVKVGGDSMIANLLRETILAFNSSSSLNITTNNLECVTTPSKLPVMVYITCGGFILLVALFSYIQVYTNRLRRVIVAFYNPEREKKRIMFLYNLMLHGESEQLPADTDGSLVMFRRLTGWGGGSRNVPNETRGRPGAAAGETL